MNWLTFCSVHDYQTTLLQAAVTTHWNLKKNDRPIECEGTHWLKKFSLLFMYYLGFYRSITSTFEISCFFCVANFFSLLVTRVSSVPAMVNSPGK